jgi:hypothetical protein
MRPVFATRTFHTLPFVIALVLSGCGGSTSTLPTSTAPIPTPVATLPVARVEVIPFQTLTLTDQEFLSGREDGTPVRWRENCARRAPALTGSRSLSFSTPQEA